MKKIVLLCAAGMSTSILAKKMEEAAAKMDYPAEVAAYPTSEAREKTSGADIILLGPQVRFQQKKIEELCPGIPVEAVDMRLYGRMDGEGIIRAVREKLGD